MILCKEEPKGTKEAIRRTLDILDGLIQEFPGGKLEYENTDNVVSTWYKKVWKVDDAKITMEVVIGVAGRSED